MPCGVEKQIKKSNDGHGSIIKIVIVGFAITWILMFGFSRCHANENKCVTEQEIVNALNISVDDMLVNTGVVTTDCNGCKCLHGAELFECLAAEIRKRDEVIAYKKSILDRVERYGICREE